MNNAKNEDHHCWISTPYPTMELPLQGERFALVSPHRGDVSPQNVWVKANNWPQQRGHYG